MFANDFEVDARREVRVRWYSRRSSFSLVFLRASHGVNVARRDGAEDRFGFRSRRIGARFINLVMDQSTSRGLYFEL